MRSSLIFAPRRALKRSIRTLCLALLAASLAMPALAGQVHIKLSGISFTPNVVSLNRGDHVVWVWVSGSHTVTSGSSCNPSGVFNTSNASSNIAFTWKSDRTGSVPFFCIPHCTSGMTGNLTISVSGASVADFRITEVQYNAAGGADLIEIANLGTAAGDLSRYRIVSSTDSATVPTTTFNVAAGSRVTVHVGVNGAQSPSTGQLFLPTLTDLPDVAGSIALYVPNLTGGASLTDSLQIIDYVQWGAGGQAHEATAAGEGLWTAGEFIPTVANGHDMEFCGLRGQYGMTQWAGITTPNFGSNGNCSTPTNPTTWGRIKSIYR